MPLWTGNNPLIDGTDYPIVAHVNEIRSYMNNGWMLCSNWTKSSFASTAGLAPLLTITFTGDGTPYMSIGDRARFTDGSNVRYGYLTSVSVSSGTTTLIIVLDGSVSSVTNTTLTSCAFSKSSVPNGFPSSLTWTPTFTPFSSMTYSSPTLNWARFNISGRLVTFNISDTGTIGGTANAFMLFTYPLARIGTDSYSMSGGGFIQDSAYHQAWNYWNNTSTTQGYFTRYDAANFSTGTVLLNIQGTYYI